MDKNKITVILSETQKKLLEIFKDNLIFGFVCGGFAKGYADENHDIDVFACLEVEPDETTYKKYLDWYFDIHKRYGIKADYDYPGEIITLEKLQTTLKILDSLKLTLEISEVATKKAIIWADMITSNTAAHTGNNLELLKKIKEQYMHYPEKWKKEVLAMISKEERQQWKDKSHLLIMERFMKYPKHDGKKLDSVYA